nr:reverse transcriptase domain-containing protein [Tanacetum cinerariifolium]
MSSSNPPPNFSRKPSISVRQVWRRTTPTPKSPPPSQSVSPSSPSRATFQPTSPPTNNSNKKQMMDHLHYISQLLDINLHNATNAYSQVPHSPRSPSPPLIYLSTLDQVNFHLGFCHYHAEYTIKVPPPPPVQKPKPSIQRNLVLHTRDSLPPHIPELKCKALADLEASINLMPLSVWKKLGLPDLIPTRMTLELANRAICTPDGIARDVFVPVDKFTFLADFVVVNYESDHRVPLILGRPFLRTARALIVVHGEEMILCDEDERLTLNMKHDTASYSNHPHRDSVNLINIFNLSSEDCLEDLVSNNQSGNPTFSLHKEIASPEVIHEFYDLKGCTFLSEELSDIDSFNNIHPHFDDPLSGSTTFSATSLLEEFADELALITYPSDYDDNLACDIESDIREIEFLLYQGEDFDFEDSIDQSDLTHCDDLFVDPPLKMFTDEQPPDYSFLPRFDVYPDDFLEIESDDTFDDSFDSEGEKIKEAELLIYQLDLPCDILSESVKIITRVTQEKKLLADLGASINLMPLSVWRKLGLPDLILTQMTLELANRAICTPDGIARDVFVPVGKFTFPVDFVVVNYESDHRVPLILGRPFLRTARALIDVHGEEMILCDGDERLTLNMKHDTASYSNHPYRESVNLINIFNLSTEDCLKDLVSNKQSGNPTFSLHKEIASSEVILEFHDSKGCSLLSEELPDFDSFNDIHPHFDDDPLSGSTTYSATSLLEEFADELALITYPPDYDDNRVCDIDELKYKALADLEASINLMTMSVWKKLGLPNLIPTRMTLELANRAICTPDGIARDVFVPVATSLLEEFADELALITYPSDYDDNLACDIESDIKEIEFLLYQGEDSIDQSDLTHCDDLFVDPTLEMFTDEQPPGYSFPPRFDVYPDDFLEIESDDTFDDSFDSEGEKIKEAELLIYQLDLPCDILSESVKIITRVTQEKKLAVSYASLFFEDFDPPFYELLVFKEVPNSMRLLLFSSENEEKVFKPEIYTSKKVKENPKKNKIISKPNKNGKRGESQEKSEAVTVDRGKKLKKTQKERSEMQTHAKSTKALKKERKNKGCFEPKNYKDALTQACWIKAMQEELNEFERLEVWELVPHPNKVTVITLKWIYKVKLDELGGILRNKA